MSAPARLATASQTGSTTGRTGIALLIAGAVTFCAALAVYFTHAIDHPASGWLNAVDLNVYRESGQVVRHMSRLYNPHLSAPLYSWPGKELQFTYTPFAALVFTVFTLAPLSVLRVLWVVVNIGAVVAAIWFTLGGLGYRRGLPKLGGTLLASGVLLWTEPAQRTIFLGQIELVLMALVLWDLCQPDGRRWKGAGVGIAAGLKLVPLIFIPYLLLTKRYRQAGVATATFVATIVIGFAVLPGDSARWWFHGLFVKSGRTGFIGWEGNQSLPALVTRLAGSVHASTPLWLALSAVVAVIGLGCAALLDRAGHPMPGILLVALTALLVSPISWDHHWVWVIPAVVVLAVYALRSTGAVRYCLAAAAVVVTVIFGAYPGFFFGKPLDLGAFSEGLIFLPKNTSPGVFDRIGDRPWFVEYHWRGAELIVGNLYVLTGVIAFAVLVVVVGVRSIRQSPETVSQISPTAQASSTTGVS